MIADRLAEVRRRVAQAALDAGRDPADVRLLLATKTQPVDLVREALEADARARAEDPTLTAVLVGENRVQELVAKGPALAGLATRAPDRAVAVQQGQRGPALGVVHRVGGVAGPGRAALRARDRAAGRLRAGQRVRARSRSTAWRRTTPSRSPRAVAALPGLRVAGLMTVGARSDDAAVVRAGYALLRSLRDEIVAAGTQTATELSMGMSGDLELAVAEGATLVRVGSAVFGARPT